MELSYRYIKNEGHEETTRKIGRQNCYFLRFLFILLLLQPVFESGGFGGANLFSYLDDSVALVLLICFIFKSLTGFVLKREEQKIVGWSFALLILGLLSSLVFYIQPVQAVLVDAFTCFKFLFAYLGIRSLYSERISPFFIDKNFNLIAKIFAVLFFVLTLHDSIFAPFFPYFDYRYSLYSIRLFYPHPQGLAEPCIILTCILASSLERHKSNLVYILMFAFVIFRTLRVKSIGFILVFFILLVLVYWMKLHSDSVILVLLLCCGLYVSWDQLQNVFLNDTQARAIMLRGSFVVANQYFPLGSGFGTFGSHMASVYYSPIYSAFGYGKLYEMSAKSGSFLTDIFWPTVIAQFGYIGLLLFLVIVFYLFKMAFQLKKADRSDYVATLSILIYMMIVSTSESAFFNPNAVPIFIIFGLLVCQGFCRKSDQDRSGAVTVYQSKYIK